MKFLRWQRFNRLPRLFAMPPPQPVEQAVRIVAIQRTIVLPVKAMVAAAVLYYLFYKLWIIKPVTTRDVFLEYLQHYFIFYVVFNAVAAALLLLRRFPVGLVQWVVFTVGLLDGLLLAGLTAYIGGFSSILFWIFPGLILVNALSIPLATPQIVLNLLLSAFYLAAGLVANTISDDDASRAAAPIPTVVRINPEDIANLGSLALKLRQPAAADHVSQYLAGRLSPETSNSLAAYDGGTNTALRQAIARELTRVLHDPSLYDSNRFAGVKLVQAKPWLGEQRTADSNQVPKLNRALLLDAYPEEISKTPRASFMSNSQLTQEPLPSPEGDPFQQIMILWLITAACYGVQLLSFRDRLAEEESRKSSARNDELKAAGRLAAEIAHQLKNPLGIINNAAFSLQRGLKEGRNDFNLQIEIIREEIERSDRFLTQLMGYALLSEGRVEKLDLAGEIDIAVAEVFPPGANYPVEIHRDYGPALPHILMQRSHLSVVLVNLLQNAREALHGRGHIHLETRWAGDNFVEVAIADDGPGIPADKLEKIFEPYFTSKKRGTGLGLAIVKHNVELYGGNVRVESGLGKGACFILVFPAKTLIRTA